MKNEYLFVWNVGGVAVMRPRLEKGMRIEKKKRLGENQS